MKTIMKSVVVAVVLVVGTVGFAADGDWNWSIAPYAWLSGMEGSMTVGPVETRIDKDFADIFSDLELGAMLTVDANNGTWGVMGDAVYVKLKSKQETLLGDIRGRIEEWIVSAVPYYRVMSDETIAIDIGAGGRYITTDVQISGPVSKNSSSRDWVDPVVMARARVQLTQKFAMIVTGDIGGFGIESDLTWEIIGTASYAMTDNTDFIFGYRYLDYDYSDKDFTYDISTSGFILGAKFNL